MKSPASHRPQTFHYITVVLLGLGLYVIVPQLADLRQSFQALRSVDLTYVFGAVISTFVTFFIASTTYACLARSPIRYHRTVLVAIANMFTNRLLPAGAGSIATYYLYLRRNRHSATQAGSVIAANNFLGTLSHVFLLVILLVLFPRAFESFAIPVFRPGTFLVVAGIVVAAVLLSIRFKPALYSSVAKNSRQLFRNLASYRQRPWRLTAAFTTSLLLTICNAVTLFLCAQAVGIELGPIMALAVFTIGIVAGTATPTPGGLGGVEAGLLAGLTGFGVAAEPALAVVILYRLIGYWLTLAMGIVTYSYINRRGYLHAVR